MLAHGSDSLSLHASCCVGPSVVLGPNPTPQPRLAAVHLFGGYPGYEVSPSHSMKLPILLPMKCSLGHGPSHPLCLCP